MYEIYFIFFFFFIYLYEIKFFLRNEILEIKLLFFKNKQKYVNIYVHVYVVRVHLSE